MSKIWYFPIEPYEERYTKGLDEWVHSELQRKQVEYETIYGEDNIKQDLGAGEVLGVEGRHIYCFSQLQKFMKLIRAGEVKDGDIFFTTDFWFTGLEALGYIKAMRKLKLKTYGFVCSGSFETHDFTNLSGMTPWAQYIERGWCKIFDGLFVANVRMKGMVKSRVDKTEWDDKIIVTGLPANTDWILSKVPDKSTWDKSHPMVVFPHRWDDEKDPMFFVKVMEEVQKEKNGVIPIVTTGRKSELGTSKKAEIAFRRLLGHNVLTLSKPAYYDMLTKCSVVFSSALQDTVGNAMIESMTLGCAPVVPQGQYEYLPEEFCYRRGDIEHAKDIVLAFLEKPTDCSKYVKQFDRSIEKMIDHMVG